MTRRLPPGAPVVTAAEMRAAEAAVFASGVAQDVLMERAGAAVAREALRFAEAGSALVLAGPGNNGGDAYVVARHLRAAGVDVVVEALGTPRTQCAAVMRERWAGPVVGFGESAPRALVIDGLFGTGMARPLDSGVTDRLCHLFGHAGHVVAIDLPSGIDTDSGAALGLAGGTTATVALGALKPAHLLGAGVAGCGHVFWAPIGIPVETQWRTAARPRLSAPAVDAHKYSRGMVVVVQGAMPGAAVLSAHAALCAGAGYALLAGVEPSSGGPEALVRRRICGAGDLHALIGEDRVGAVVLGPGLGRGEGREEESEVLLDAVLGTRHPLVLDGDALSLLGTEAGARLRERVGSTCITPHGGEFARMFGTVKGSKITATMHAARETGAVVLHKGADSVVAAPDGRVRILSGASSWLSTAGTGDVLAGVLAARLATGEEPLAAAEAAVWLHARAGGLAGAAFPADGLIAHLPEALSECL